MFRKKGEQQDAIHHTNIKRGITSNFARTLKILQQKHLQSDGEEYIYSNDASNNLCNSLEAVFLHGLKDSVAHKLTAYVGLAAAPNESSAVNFWSVAVKFTHGDVVTQLQSLSQINSEIGLCRAWIRLALNDGLMESYLHSMVVDVKTLRYFYHSHSYLRDHEQPGILKNYLTGLMSLAFKLSYNSSVLNLWNNSTLQLAGVLDTQHIPPPAIKQSEEKDKVTDPPKETKELNKDTSKPKEEPIVVSKNTPLTTKNEETPMFSSIHDVEELRRVTAERAKGASLLSSSVSEGSTSSRVSCPDPGVNTDQASRYSDLEVRSKESPGPSPLVLFGSGEDKDTHSYKEEKHEEDDEKPTAATSEKTTLSNTESAVRSVVIVEESSPQDIAASPGRPRSRRVDDEDLKQVSLNSLRSPGSLEKAMAAEYDKTHTEDDSEIVYTPSSSPQDDSHIHREFRKRHKSPDRHAAEENSAADGHSKSAFLSPHHSHHRSRSSSPAREDAKGRARTYEEICATLPPVKLDPMEQEAILKKVLKEFDKQADKEREKRESKGPGHQDIERESSEAKKPKPGENTVPTLEEGTHIQRSLTPEPKSATLRSRTSSPVPSAQSDHTQQSNDDSKHAESHKKHEHKKHGHKHDLSGLKDTASSDTEEANRKEKSKPKKEESSSKLSEEKAKKEGAPDKDKEGDEESELSMSPSRFGNSLSSMTGWSSEIESRERSSSERNRAESFATMLRSYAPEQEHAVTLNQVIEDLAHDSDDDVDGGPTSGTMSPSQSIDIVQRQDSCLEEFEVLSSPTGSLCGQVDANSSRMIFLFRVPREHGLSHQNFTCRGCSRPIGIIYGQPRLCEFDGGLYCYECHENNEAYIPSSIVFDWDFRKKKVCRENYKFLQELEDQALYDIEELNPKLYNHVTELQDLKLLRQQLCYLKSYLFTCSQKVAESLRQKVWPREHLYDRRDLYSINDLLQVQSGTLHKLLKDLVKFASQHVYDCPLCSQKGFVCEICRNPKVIYPFEIDTTMRCKSCKAVYHKTCMTESLPCPKCERWGRRVSCGNIAEDHPEDYGMSPPLS